MEDINKASKNSLPSVADLFTNYSPYQGVSLSGLDEDTIIDFIDEIEHPKIMMYCPKCGKESVFNRTDKTQLSPTGIIPRGMVPIEALRQVQTRANQSQMVNGRSKPKTAQAKSTDYVNGINQLIIKWSPMSRPRIDENKEWISRHNK